MKLTQRQKKEFNSIRADDDDERFHSRFDDVVLERLKELDPEFYEDLIKISRGMSFWYA
jgi:hypothetical protein